MFLTTLEKILIIGCRVVMKPATTAQRLALNSLDHWAVMDSRCRHTSQICRLHSVVNQFKAFQTWNATMAVEWHFLVAMIEKEASLAHCSSWPFYS